MSNFRNVVRELHYVKGEIEIFCKFYLHCYVPLDALWRKRREKFTQRHINRQGRLGMGFRNFDFF